MTTTTKGRGRGDAAAVNEVNGNKTSFNKTKQPEAEEAPAESAVPAVVDQHAVAPHTGELPAIGGLMGDFG